MKERESPVAVAMITSCPVKPRLPKCDNVGDAPWPCGLPGIDWGLASQVSLQDSGDVTKLEVCRVCTFGTPCPGNHVPLSVGW